MAKEPVLPGDTIYSLYKDGRLIFRRTAQPVREEPIPEGLNLSRLEDKAYLLTEQERAQWNQLTQQEQQLTRDYEQAILLAIDVPVGDRSRDVHAAIQRTWLGLNLVRARRDAIQAQLRADHGCKDCEIMNGQLARPKL